MRVLRRIALELRLAQGAAKQVLPAFVLDDDMRLIAVDVFAAHRVFVVALPAGYGRGFLVHRFSPCLSLKNRGKSHASARRYG
jgi:hypothetical protein